MKGPLLWICKLISRYSLVNIGKCASDDPFLGCINKHVFKYTQVIVKSEIQYALNLNTLLFQNKYFDSGEYNMTRAKMRGSKLPPAAQENMILQEPPGDAIPTPEAIATIRKPSLQQSKLAEHS